MAPVSSRLGLGEHEAITLAQSFRSPLLLIDEVRGRREAKRLGIRVTGTLGLLQQAQQNNLLDLHEAIARLRLTSFQATPDLLEAVLRDAAPL